MPLIVRPPCPPESAPRPPTRRTYPVAALEAGGGAIAVLFLQYAASRGIPGAAEALAAAERQASPQVRDQCREMRERFEETAEGLLTHFDRTVPSAMDLAPHRALRPPLLGLPAVRQDAARSGVRKGIPDHRC